MRYGKISVANLLLVFSLSPAVWAEANENGRADSRLVNFNVRAGLNTNYAYYSGFGANVSGSVEFPISKTIEGWKMNVGVKMLNANFFMPQEKMSSMFVQVPFVFSYDFRIRPTVDLRLSFGAFYSYHAGGAVYGKDNYRWDANMFLPHSGGLNVGLGFYARNVFLGVDYDVCYDYESVLTAVSIMVGYRF